MEVKFLILEDGTEIEFDKRMNVLDRDDDTLNLMCNCFRFFFYGTWVLPGRKYVRSKYPKMSIDAKSKRYRLCRSCYRTINELYKEDFVNMYAGIPNNMPLIMYYPKNRIPFLNEEFDHKKIKQAGLRDDVYFDCLNEKFEKFLFENFFHVEKLFVEKKHPHSSMFDSVMRAIFKYLNMEKELNLVLLNDLTEKKGSELMDYLKAYIKSKTNEVFAIVFDLAYRTYRLNPHQGENAFEKTEGVVLIEEAKNNPEFLKLDKVFNNMQFILG